MLVRALVTTGLILTGAVRAGATPPDLQASTDQSDTGAYALSWNSDGEAITLEEATRADFSDARVLYDGSDQATVVSGQMDGVYYYRIRRDEEVWGGPVQVSVTHHSLREAMSFLVVGGAVFLATALLILAGHRQHRREFPRDPGASP